MEVDMYKTECIKNDDFYIKKVVFLSCNIYVNIYIG